MASAPACPFLRLQRDFFGSLLILLLTVLFAVACRVESVRSLTREDSSRDALFFATSDPTRRGSLASPLSFAMAFESIEPPRPTSLAGFGGGARRLLPPNYAGADGYFTYCLPYKDVDLAPRVKVLLWQGNDPKGVVDTFAIIAIDVVAVPSDVTRKIISFLAENHPTLRLDHGNLQVVASHTHAGPAGLTENPFWSVFACDRYSSAYWAYFETQVAQAFAAALASKRPITEVTRRTTDLPGFNTSRFKGMEVDDRLLSFSFSQKPVSAKLGSRQGEPCLQVFAAHPTYFGQTQLTLSSDLVGHVERELVRVNRGAPCVFLNGAVGNADATTGDGLDDYAQRFAEIAFNPEKGTWTSAGAGLEFSARILDLPTPKPNLKACGVPPIDAFVSARILGNLPPRTKIAYARLGKTLFVFYPGEPVKTVSDALQKAILAARKDVDVVQVLGVSNDYLGYVVDSDDFDTQTLESCSTLYGRRIADTLRNAVVELVTQPGMAP